MKNYLFACVHNAGRSQMAAAFFRAAADAAKATGVSAGTEPGERVHPVVVEAMLEVGIDLRGIVPAKLTDAMAEDAAMLITMGCGEACPYVAGLPREDWPLEDPKGKAMEAVRGIRDDVKRRVENLVKREGVGR